jgi:hypothetical protein
MPNNFGNQPVWYGSGNDAESVNEATWPYPGMLGTRHQVKQPGPPGTPGAEDYRDKAYQLVQVDSTATTAPYRGAVAWWSDKSKYLVTTVVTTLGRGRVAGVFQNAIGLGNYGYIQIKGPATVKFTDSVTATPTAAGLFVIPSATDGKADCLAAGSAATYPPLGVSAGSFNAAAREGIVDLDVPETF